VYGIVYNNIKWERDDIDITDRERFWLRQQDLLVAKRLYTYLWLIRFIYETIGSLKIHMEKCDVLSFYFTNVFLRYDYLIFGRDSCFRSINTVMRYKIWCNFSTMCLIVSVRVTFHMIVHSTLVGVSCHASVLFHYITLMSVEHVCWMNSSIDHFWMIIWCKKKPGS